ncbi:MAG: phosphomannomutase/phosphoglucomutase [Candidatus Pacebacteria bacterium]|nr:phosphomannomutase/phosphoglucomutase [Candidatus Paceibacterota bacterium]
MSIFKAYDVRGIYPEEVNEQWAYKIGRAFAIFLQKETGKKDLKIVLAMDNRLSSDSLYTETERGMIEQGVTVIKIGLASTPMLYFAVANYGFDGGISVTCSHNTKEYNGFKIVRSGAFPIGEDSGLEQIEKLASNDFAEPADKGQSQKKEILNDYIKKNEIIEDYPFKVFVDTANGVAGLPAGKILNKSNFISIFGELDGNFPNHDPNPLKEGSLNTLCSKIIEQNGDLGIAFDGDGDRVFFIDERGKMISSDLILALCAEHLLRNNKGAKILYDIRCSNIVKEVIDNNGGIGIISRVGHSFIKKIMREQDIIFGGEYSGHFYSKNDYFAENPFMVVAIILSEIKRQGKPISEIINNYKKYFHSGEINFKVSDKEAKIKEIKERFGSGKISLLDGVRIDFEKWWFSLRASNTEPLLRLIIEAETEELLQEMIEEISKIIIAE